MDPSIAHLGDIPLEIEAQLTCHPLSLEQLLELQPGSIVKSYRAAGDSVDIRIGRQPICQGEVIVANNRLAVRLSDFEERS